MKMITYDARNFRSIEYMKYLPEQLKHEIDIVSKVLPFKVNNYVTDYLIDWDNYETDPMYILTFPNKKMLRDHDYAQVEEALKKKLSGTELYKIVNSVRLSLNPHPANQLTNVPTYLDEPLEGVQHKYKDIVLFFPSQGQTCHANCTFCFRWPQFVKELDLQFARKEIDGLIDYIRSNDDIHEILFTGGDPMIMSPASLKKYIDALIEAKIPHLQSIRFGSKSLTYWPFTFIPEINEEAEAMLDIFRKIVDSGLHLSFMGHFNHPKELTTEAVQLAIKNIRNTGAEIRTQAPMLKHINDSSDVWRDLWTQQVQLGLIPYYMFVERETGPYDYFSVPLAEVYKIYQNAIKFSSSLGKTVTGPVMSASPGKVQIMGVIENPANQQKYFLMQFVRHRDVNKTFKPFFRQYDEKATWFDQLKKVESTEILV